ncbi:WD40 repeat domain-containing protein, partial [Marinobacter lutaoensis]|uniref:WD40 repeat domain-containing protein n=1 Tax=Marinobacter lutaoensis TaxID=135739 RepID=UPI001C3CF06C
SAAPVMTASVSSDGAYALTAHRDQKLILWDLAHQTREIISRDANSYAAYFVKEQPVFVWQNLDNTVKVQSLSGEIKQQFTLDRPVYGHLMTRDLQTYYYSDLGWSLFRRNADGTSQTLKATDENAFLGYHKLLNLAMDTAEQRLVTAGSGEPKGFEPPYYQTLAEVLEDGENYKRLYSVALWDLNSGEPIAKLDGNSSKTHAAISPDGQWVVSGDENGIGLYWNTNEPTKRHRLASYVSGIFIPSPTDDIADASFDDSKLIAAPKGVNTFTLAVAFIDHSQYYLRFGNNSHIAALFETGSPWPVKYFDLGAAPELVTYGSQYSRNTAIATAPEAGILVMGHRSGGGISVYRFNAEALTLERIWVAE